MRFFFRAILKFLSEADILLLALSLASAIFGTIMISSIVRNFPQPNNTLYVQIGSIVIGVVLFVLFSYVDIDIIADKSWFLLLFSALFISTLYFWGEGMEEVGNRAWLRFYGIGIQPAEVVKVPFVIIIARMMTNYRERKSLNSIVSLLQILLVFVLLFVLILFTSADLGSALVYALILIIMLFVGGVKLRWFALAAVIVVALAPLFRMYLTDLQEARIIAPFFPDAVDPDMYERVTWQTSRSVEAIASGGILGQGLGNGRMAQRPRAIPAHHTDFIFAAVGEELGFLGCLLVLGLLVAIIVRCIYVGVKSNNPLGLLVCTGLAAMIIVQTVGNIGMCLGILPVIGITLPFFSYGGSSIVTCFAAMGIVSGIKMRPKPVRFRSL